MPIVFELSELCLEKNSRALGLDYGDKRIGVAISDISFTVAHPFAVLASHQVFDKLFKILDEYKVSLIVVGKPIALSGESVGKQLEKVIKFCDKLLSLRDIQIMLWDERFSTYAANQHMQEGHLSLKKQKLVRDKIAACFILQGWLDFKKTQSTKQNLDFSRHI